MQGHDRIHDGLRFCQHWKFVHPRAWLFHYKDLLRGPSHLYLRNMLWTRAADVKGGSYQTFWTACSSGIRSAKNVKTWKVPQCRWPWDLMGKPEVAKLLHVFLSHNIPPSVTTFHSVPQGVAALRCGSDLGSARAAPVTFTLGCLGCLGSSLPCRHCLLMPVVW